VRTTINTNFKGLAANVSYCLLQISWALAKLVEAETELCS